MNDYFTIYSYKNEDEWKSSLLDKFCKIIIDRLMVKDELNIAVSGGKTPIPFFNYIYEKWHENKSWINRLDKINIFWVDERQVPISHQDSNAGNFKKIIKELPFNLFIIKGDTEDIAKEVIRYDHLIRTKIAGANFDLIVLGIGEDGHIASLFPNTSGLNNENDLIIANSIQEKNLKRFTFTYKLLNKNERLWILISGKKKLQLIEDFRNEISQNYPFEKLLYENKHKTEIYCYE
ncbi:MAG: 6-phosphogluconolactonase [Bacteroidales bacterium]|nr:6-phosphogluconolactonase [Bacteroidales bacterium]